AVASNPEKDRRLCHSMGPPQIQTDGPLDQGREGLVRSAAPSESSTLRPLADMPWQRPNIGSRMKREVHVRFWERLRVKLPRATRQSRHFDRGPAPSGLPRSTDIVRPSRHVGLVPKADLSSPERWRRELLKKSDDNGVLLALTNFPLFHPQGP